MEKLDLDGLRYFWGRLEAIFSGHRRRIEDLEQRATALENRATALEGRVDTQETNYTALEARVAALEEGGGDE